MQGGLLFYGVIVNEESILGVAGSALKHQLQHNTRCLPDTCIIIIVETGSGSLLFLNTQGSNVLGMKKKHSKFSGKGVKVDKKTRGKSGRLKCKCRGTIVKGIKNAVKFLQNR